eukprot:scaffold214409_cov33-Tisochrysis_lutea.AAC.7
MPSAQCSELKGAPASRAVYDNGVVCRLPARAYRTQERDESARTPSEPPSGRRKSRACFAPRKRVRVSESCPEVSSIRARRSTPLERPMHRKRAGGVPGRPSGMRARLADSACAGRARTESTFMHSSGSRERMRMVLSKPPTARKRLRARPEGTAPSSTQDNSSPMSFLSSSERAPVASSSKYTTSPPARPMTTCRSLAAAWAIGLPRGGCHSAARPSERMWRMPAG